MYIAFGKWLKKQRHRDDPIGDLAVDLERDNKLRRMRGEPPRRGPLLRYMRDRLPGTAAWEAFLEAEREWKDGLR
jgi:hypothetical protein